MTAIKRPDHEPKVERYYPDVVAPAKELKKLAAAENPEFQILWDQAWEWMKNTFVYDFSEDGCERWEKMLGITPELGESFEDRRANILFRLNNNVAYTERSLKKIYDSGYGVDSVIPEVRHNDYILALHLFGDAVWQPVKIKNYTRAIVPANLIIKTCREIATIEIPCLGAGTVQSYSKTSVDMTGTFVQTVDDSHLHVAGKVVHSCKSISISGGVLNHG